MTSFQRIKMVLEWVVFIAVVVLFIWGAAINAGGESSYEDDAPRGDRYLD